MGERIEYPKKLSFATESDMDLFEGILKAHRSDKNHKSDGDFLMCLLKEKYMPTDEKAFELCKHLYSRKKNKDSEEFTENVFSVLESLFVHLAGNFKSGPYSRNYALVHFVASITDKKMIIPDENSSSSDLEEYKTIKNSLMDLCTDVTRKAQEEKKKRGEDVRDASLYIRELIREGGFLVQRMFENLADEYSSFCDYVSYYKSLACLCRMVSSRSDAGEEERYQLISLIKNMSRYWDTAKK